jgi:uncharacterized MAPEG superfamily protein
MHLQTQGDAMDFNAFIKSLQELPIPDLTFTGMPGELTILALATVFGLLQLLVAARFNNGQRGLAWNLGARDGEPPPVSAVAGRLERAYRNFMETFPFFAVAVILADVSGRLSWLTMLGAVVYFGARVVYWPLYAFGVPGIRTLVWLVSMIGLGMVLAASFIPPM